MGPHERLEALKKIDYIGAEFNPPTEDCYELARTILDFIVKEYKAPNRIVPSAMEGICFAWVYDDWYADIEIYNDGDIGACISGPVVKESTTIDVDAWTLEVLPFDLLTTFQRFKSHFPETFE